MMQIDKFMGAPWLSVWLLSAPSTTFRCAIGKLPDARPVVACVNDFTNTVF